MLIQLAKASFSESVNELGRRVCEVGTMEDGTTGRERKVGGLSKQRCGRKEDATPSGLTKEPKWKRQQVSTKRWAGWPRGTIPSCAFNNGSWPIVPVGFARRPPEDVTLRRQQATAAGARHERDSHFHGDHPIAAGGQSVKFHLSKGNPFWSRSFTIVCILSRIKERSKIKQYPIRHG